MRHEIITFSFYSTRDTLNPRYPVLRTDSAHDEGGPKEQQQGGSSTAYILTNQHLTRKSQQSGVGRRTR
ncbi:unnamed protein product [Prunus armeniaca]|uniref:Uncharacterized protein n=1 Tax=Prunus armeniaca TaxID=36596 RepID=A0A6J5XU30_PRUAR|nr:unnamed protein product [Prunus armeniaca]